MRRPSVEVSAKMICASRSRSSGLAITRSSVPGRFFFICERLQRDVERAGFEQPLDGVAQHLRAESSILASITRDGESLRRRRCASPSKHAQHVGVLREIAIARAVAGAR